jgi:Rrf2 family protein
MLNQTAEYAVRAVLFVAELPEGSRAPVGTIAEALDIPRNYLSKVLYELARTGILSSARGPAGGFSLAADPRSLSLAQVIERFDPIHDRCLLMRRPCSEINPCLAHDQWKEVSVAIRRFFRTTSIADLLASAPAAKRRAALGVLHLQDIPA